VDHVFREQVTTLIFFKKGIPVERIVGVIKEAGLSKKIEGNI